MGKEGKLERAVIAACACAVVLLAAEGATARPRKRPPPPPQKDVAAPVITHEALTAHSGNPPVVVKASIVDEGGVFEPTLVVRKKGGAFMRVSMTPVAEEPDAFSAEVPVELLDADLEYLIEAFDTNGNGPARAGAEDAPLVVVRTAPLPPDPAPIDTAAAPPPVEEEGSATPILIGAGVVTGLVVLVGAGVAVAVLLYSSAREPDPTSTRVTVEAPAPVAALRVGSVR